MKTPRAKKFGDLALHKKLALLAYTFLFAVVVLGSIVHRDVVILFLGITTALLLTIQIQIYERIRQLQTDQTAAYRQIGSMFSMFSLLKLESPLPPMTRFAIYPDFGNLIIQEVKERKPRMIVEAGSGVSSVIIAYCLKELGAGKLISLEHDKDYADITRKNLEYHGLQGVATVRYAPLKETRINDQSWMWYDCEQIKDLDSIDILVIDGPPGKVQPLARYPAVPLLFEALKDDSIILLDDAKRKDEQQVVKLWVEEYGCLESQRIDTHKGAVVLKRVKH